jgi:hypothetical protein
MTADKCKLYRRFQQLFLIVAPPSLMPEYLAASTCGDIVYLVNDIRRIGRDALLSPGRHRIVRKENRHL